MQGFTLEMLLPIGIIAIFFFMVIMPQRKRDKETKAMQSALSVGDQVVTIGGICGVVTFSDDNYIVIESGDYSTKLKFERFAVRNVIKAES